jgi:preprotein translocase SecE subunit
MAKKQNEAVEVEVVAPEQAEETKAKRETKTQKATTKKSPKKKEKGQNKLVTKTKETISELKKVSWPSFKTVCKNTGVVISVVLIFTVVLFGLDRLLSFLYTLIPGAM